VLAVHGLGASALYWDVLAQALPDRRLTAVDLLGFGRSPTPDGASYDLACHVDAIEPFLTERAVVVAHSTGCIVALALAARHPDLVSRLVLTGLPAWPDPATAATEVARLGVMARWTATGNPLGQRACRLVCDHRPLAAVLAPLLVRSVPAAVAIDGTRHSWPSYSRTLHSVAIGQPTPPLIAATQTRVSVIHGRDDPTARCHWVEGIPPRSGLQVRYLDGVGHHPALRAPAVVAAAVSATD
jgi:pimeloyl-ACP methyl ester carboxylesterase